MLSNAVTDNDPDKFLDLMNQYTYKKWGWAIQNGTIQMGRWFRSFRATTILTRYDVNANNEITAQGHVYSGLSHRKTTCQKCWNTPSSSYYHHGRYPYEQSYDNYNTSLEGGKFALKGTDGLKLDPARLLTTTTPRQPSGKQRIIEVILGVGNYDVEIAESYRNQIGNTLTEKMFADYQYKKSFLQAIIPSTGRPFTWSKTSMRPLRRGRSQPLNWKTTA